MVSPQSFRPCFPLLLLKPQFGVPTPWAYSRWGSAKEIPGVDYQQQDHEGHSFINELERPVFEKFVFLARVKNWLLDQREVVVALMSGSGSTVFAVLHNPEDAGPLISRAKQELDPNLWTCACTTM